MGAIAAPYGTRQKLKDGLGQTARLKRARAALALARAGVGACDIVALGDSVTEGNIVTDYATRYVNVLVAELRRDWQPAGITGGVGYVPTTYQSATVVNPWTVAGAGALTSDYGLGRRSYRLNATGHNVSLTATGTGFDLHYLNSSSGSFTVAVDGGAADIVTMGNTAGDTTAVYQKRGLSEGSHTVTVTWASGTVSIHGAMLYNGDEAAGIRLWEGGHSGHKTSDLSGSTSAGWPDAIAAIQPSLVLIELGTNDWAAAVSPATVQANLAAIISLVRAACVAPPSIVLMPLYARGGVSNQYVWQQYVDAHYTLATADAGELAIVDLGPLVTTAGTTMVADGAHPSVSGHRLIGQSLARVIGG